MRMDPTSVAVTKTIFSVHSFNSPECKIFWNVQNRYYVSHSAGSGVATQEWLDEFHEDVHATLGRCFL